MKKLLGIIISLLMFIPLVVLADMSGPMVREFEFEVTNPDGAMLYDCEYNDENMTCTALNKKVPYGFKFTSMDEEIEEYIYVEDEKYNAYIKTSDGRAIVDDFKITAKEIGEKMDIIALENLEIKKGPSPAYASTGVTIKAGTKLKASDILENDGENKYVHNHWDPWLYVEYNNTKGFIIALDGTVGFDYGKRSAITIVDTGMYEKYITEEGEKPIATIPANTKLTTQTYGLDVWSSSYYIEYNGKKGFVSQYEYLVEEESIEFTATQKLNVYANVKTDDEGNITSKVVGTVAKGTKFSSKYYDPENEAITIRYENGNVKGWIYAKNDEDDNSSDYYVGLSFKYPEEEDDVTEPTTPSKPGEDITEKPTDVDNPSDEPIVIQPQNNTKRNNSMEILYLCIAAAAIIAMTAVVTITYVNKKNKNKVEEKK